MSRPVIEADIRTLKRRARQTETGIHLALAWAALSVAGKALDVLRKLPLPARIGLGLGSLYASLYLWENRALLGLSFGIVLGAYLLYRLGHRIHEARQWTVIHPAQRKSRTRRDYYEYADGWTHVDPEDLPF